MLRLTDAPYATQFSFRGATVAAQRAGDAFGVALPTQTCRAAIAGDRAALWLGPDEWLLLAESDDNTLERDIAARLEDEPASLVDVSHRTLFFTLLGADAAPILNTGCPLDLDMSQFPVGMCTRTILEKSEIILWRTAPDEFRIGVWRSFAAYVRGVLTQGASSVG